MTTGNDDDRTRLIGGDDEETIFEYNQPASNTTQVPPVAPASPSPAEKRNSGTGMKRAVAGAALGAIAGAGSAYIFADDIHDVVDESAGNGANTLSHPEWVDGEVKVAGSVNDSMSFNQAFAAARAEVGPGGCFEWHGKLYGTYYATEWNNMSAAERAEFNDHFSWSHGHGHGGHSGHDHGLAQNHGHDGHDGHGDNHNTVGEEPIHEPNPGPDVTHTNLGNGIELVSVNHPGENMVINHDEYLPGEPGEFYNNEIPGDNFAYTDEQYITTEELPQESVLAYGDEVPESEIEILGYTHGDDHNMTGLNVDGSDVILVDVDPDGHGYMAYEDIDTYSDYNDTRGFVDSHDAMGYDDHHDTMDFGGDSMDDYMGMDDSMGDTFDHDSFDAGDIYHA